MKFALDTYRDVVSGTSERRMHALFTFGLWFAAGAYLISTIVHYTPNNESWALPAIGGIITSATAAAIKAS